MKRYGGYSRQQRKLYLCDNDIILKERFTGIESDYLKQDIITTLLSILPCLQTSPTHLIKIRRRKKKVLFVLLKRIYYFIDNIHHIQFLQTWLKHRCQRRFHKLRGPGWNHLNQCKNEEDFLYMTPIQDSDKTYFYSYKDTQENIWYFDLRSIHTLLKQKKSNPYTREEFPPLVYDQVGELIGHIQSLGHTIEIEDYKPKNLQEIVQRKIIDISVTMTQCGYTFQEQWLRELPKSKLIHLYRLLEDMWNYRVQMTREQKCCIIPPNGYVFNYPLNDLRQLTSTQILNLLADDVQKFEHAIEEGNRKLGYMYLLICLSDINLDCRIANPWVEWI